MTLGWLAYCFSYSRSLLLLHPFAPFYKPLAACSDTQFPFLSSHTPLLDTQSRTRTCWRSFCNKGATNAFDVTELIWQRVYMVRWSRVLIVLLFCALLAIRLLSYVSICVTLKCEKLLSILSDIDRSLSAGPVINNDGLCLNSLLPGLHRYRTVHRRLPKVMLEDVGSESAPLIVYIVVWFLISWRSSRPI